MILQRRDAEAILLAALERPAVSPARWRFNKQRSVLFVLHRDQQHAYSVGNMSRDGIEAVARRILSDSRRSTSHASSTQADES